MKMEPLLRLDGLPVLQNKVYPSGEAARDTVRGTLVLQEDPVTGIVTNAAFDPHLLEYDADYQNEQACSPSFQEHLREVMQILRRNLAPGRILEIGCGKGFFLEQLIAAGYDAIGIDPAYEGSRASVIRAPFSRDLGISAPGLVMRHVLEHIQDPMAFLASIAEANGNAGTVYIEVPCLDWICARRAWFDLFYEHVNYFRPSDFARMFGRVHAMGHLFGGQYLYVVADLASLRRQPPAGPRAALPTGFMDGVQACGAIAGRSATPPAIWGAGSKGVLFAHHLAAEVGFACMIDINPVKQGRFAAGTGLPIVSPAEALQSLPRGTTVFVMNPNYFDEIAGEASGRFHLVNVDTL